MLCLQTEIVLLRLVTENNIWAERVKSLDVTLSSLLFLLED